VANITYIPTWVGFLYLAVVLDAFSRKIVGWAMATHLGTELGLEALNLALWQRPQAPCRGMPLTRLQGLTAPPRQQRTTVMPRLPEKSLTHLSQESKLALINKVFYPQAHHRPPNRGSSTKIVHDQSAGAGDAAQDRARSRPTVSAVYAQGCAQRARQRNS
jgi:transposase InsO family protein